jgi:UDP:flavonoid glycosyltransferase YjiC (YdhE family)
VDPCPTDLQITIGSRRLPVRYLPYNGPGQMRPLPSPRSRPRVCVTWGTTLSQLDPELFLAGQVARAIGGRNVDVVVAVTAAQRLLLGPLPSRVHVVESMPLHLLLPTCDMVVSHGGAGTLLTALANGLPQLAIPRLPDHVRHTARVVHAGAGMEIPAPAEDRAAISDVVHELLAAPAYRAAAVQLRSQMREQPSPAQLVGQLEQLTSSAAANSAAG